MISLLTIINRCYYYINSLKYVYIPLGTVEWLKCNFIQILADNDVRGIIFSYRLVYVNNVNRQEFFNHFL